ncbi:MAG: biopolymer transporter ExbD [Phycisphaeraceae bacterium]
MSFATPTVQRSQPVLPLAAMVDMLFLLLIFFLHASALREETQQMPVDLQSTESGEVRRGSQPIFITITRDNEIFIPPRSYTPETLKAALTAIASVMPGESADEHAARLRRTPVVIRVDKLSHSGTSLEVLGLARAAGLTNALFETKKPEGKQ